jgi:hypothetical protein
VTDVGCRPPPQTDFWRNAQWQLDLSGGRKARIRVSPLFEQKDMRIPSPVHPDELYPAEFVSLLCLLACLLVVDIGKN